MSSSKLLTIALGSENKKYTELETHEKKEQS